MVTADGSIMTPTPHEADDDARTLELRERARAGDRNARAEILEGARDGLIRFCFRYLGNANDAEDAVQDVIARLVTGANWPRGSVRPFLLRAARNRCLDATRRRRDGRVGDGSFLGFSKAASETGPSSAYAREEREERLREHVLALAPDHAEVLLLRYFEDLSRKEIAEVLELPTSVVKSRLFEARTSLRKRIGETSL